jgi:hypothetical protein
MVIISNFNMDEMGELIKTLHPAPALKYLEPYQGSHLYEMMIQGIKSYKEDWIYSLVIEHYFLNNERKISIIRDIKEYAKYKQKD